ncbi:MAG: dinitrogenase iron-molybdenum cofactor biosynthesis protein [Acidobacteria bacterium]|nr:MAG: dinitrogenase iron-molybdenum cofactor biosynthesis protein [Acidobacteriota bacterium]
MKIIVTSLGPSLDSPMDVRFGRAARFILFDDESQGFQIIENTQNLNAAQGAGLQAAEIVSRAGAECVLTGHCGPKAFKALTAAGIRIYTGVDGTVAEAIDRLRAGQLKQAESADSQGHAF